MEHPDEGVAFFGFAFCLKFDREQIVPNALGFKEIDPVFLTVDGTFVRIELEIHFYTISMPKESTRGVTGG
jgi:hypothetical protein